MSNTKSPIIVIKGKVFWCQLLGEPRDGYNGPTDKEWTVDIAPDKDSLEKLRSLGVDANVGKTTDVSYIKNDDDPESERGEYITFRRKEKRSDGQLGKRVEVLDANKQPWDPSKLIGNGSTAYVRVALNTVRAGARDERIKPNIVNMMVTDLVEYAPEGGTGESESFPTFDEAKGDELPF